MQIRELHINGFGFFTNQRIEGFTKGINVIYGTNEFGKTTLLEFIRRILFGFPNKRPGVNLYPALHGGTYGGKVFSEMANGERVVISRALGSYKKGDVVVSTPSGPRYGQESLNTFLGNASQELYQNIFAFTLDELQAAGSLQGDDIKIRIYGAGMGLGAKSIIKIAENFRKCCDELFSPRGKTKKMSLLFNEIKNLQHEIETIQGNQNKFTELQSKLGKLEKEKIEWDRMVRNLETQRREQETKLHLYPLFVELKEAENEFAQLVNISEFPAHAFETFSGFKSEFNSLHNRLVEENENLEKLKIERDNVSINKKLLVRQEAVVSLRNMTEQIRVVTADRFSVVEQKELLDERIQEEIKQIGSDWNKSILENFEITQAEKGELKVYHEEMVCIRQSLNRAKEKLDEHKKQKAENISKGFNVPEWLTVVSYSLLGLGIAGFLWGWFILSSSLMAFSTIILVLGIICTRMIIKRRDSLTGEDRFDSLLTEKLNLAQVEEDEKFAKWRAWLRNKKLDEFLSPSSAQEVIGIIKQLKEHLRQSADLNKRLERMDETMDKSSELISEIFSCLGNHSPELDVETAIGMISQAYGEAEKNREKRSAIQIQIDSLSRKIERLAEQMEKKKEALQSFILSTGAVDDKDFETKHRQFEKRKSLQQVVNEKRQFIQSRVGLGKAYDDFLESIRDTHPEQIQKKLDHISLQGEEFQGSKDRSNQEMGEIRNELNQLTSNDNLLIKQSELEIKSEQFKLCARKWMVNKIAYFILEQAKQKYERERQPDVIRAAENIFCRITGGKYSRIFKPLDNEEVLIDNESGDQMGVVEMSRGTREQLYLSMRLGLIEEYEKRAEPLPVIMDDVLVNFDDNRVLSIMEILKDFAKTRQVIILSCHQQSLDNYKRFGASQITV